MDGASSHPPAREDEGPKPDADASEEDDPEPMLGLDARSVAAPPMSSEDQPEELDVAALDKHVAESLDELSQELPSDPVSRDASALDGAQRADAEAALQAAAELAKPAAEAAKAAAEEAQEEAARLANTGREEEKLTPPAQSLQETLGSVTPPQDPPEMLGGAAGEDLPVEGLRAVSQSSAPPLPPPPWQPDAEEAQKPLEPGQRVVLRGLVDYPDFNGTEGIVQRFDSTLQVYEVRVRDGQKVVLVKVACHHVSRSDSAEESQEEPPLSLALPLQDEEQILSPPNNRSAVTRTSRSSRHTRSTKSSHVETLESLHINEDSLLAKILLPYCRQVANHPKKLMTFYATAVLVPLAIFIVLRGFALESDFSAFVKADGAAMRDRDAFLLALGEKKDLTGRRLLEVEHGLAEEDDTEVEVFEDTIWEPRRLEEANAANDTSATGRRLKSLFLRKEFEVLYRARSGSILSERALQEVQRIETSMTSLPVFNRLCYTRITGEAKRFLCDPGQSLTAMAFPTQTTSQNGNVLFEVTWDGLGRDMLPPAAFLTYMKIAAERGDASRSSRKYSFHLDVGISGDSSAQVSSGINLAKEDWSELLNNELLPFFRSLGTSEVDFFYSSSDMDSIEINSTLVNDLLLAIGSILFVIFYLRIHTGTWLLSVSSFFIIFTSVPLAYVCTPAEKATIASFLSVFLITGIGCDVVFVFTDFWEQSKGRDIDCRLMWMIVHAGESCLATSMTTALSFFANLASALQPLREFGMFMGLCVMFAFSLVLLILPPLLVVAEQRRENAVKARTVDISCGDKGSMSVVQQDPQARSKPNAPGKKKDSIMQGLLFTLAGGIAGCPKSILAITGIFFITSVIGVVTNAKLSTGVPDIFPEWHNQVTSKEIRAEFASEAFLTTVPPASSLICVAHTMNGTSTAGCVLHWCEALQEWSFEETTTTTTGTAKEMFCRRSPTLRVGLAANDKQSVGYGFEACSIVNVYSRAAMATSAPSTSAWSGLLLQALEDETNPNSIEPRSMGATAIQPIVVENWETGEVNVLRFHQSANTVISPWPAEVLNGTQGICEMHVLCFEAGYFRCGLRDWKELGTGPYQLSSRRLESNHDLVPGRRLQVYTSGLVQQAVSNALDVAVLWGIRSARYTPLVGPPSEFWSYDPKFEPRNPWAQRAIRDMCTDLPEKLKIFRAKCWVIMFADFLTARRLRFPSRNFDEDVIDWYYSNTIEAQANLWFEDQKVIACKLQFWVNVPVTVASLQGLEYMKLWNEYVEAKNAQASVTANSAWHTASVWVRSEAETAIIGSTVDTIIIATCSGWAGVLLFTGDVLLAVIVTAVVIVVITGLAFFMVSVMGWAIGPIEVIALVVFVGYSVTYALHIAHNYNQMVASDADLLEAEEKARKRQADREQAKAARKRANLNQEEGEGVDGVELAVTDADQEVLPEDLDGLQLRKARTRVAVLHVGGATLSSALSTAGSSAFLLFCTLTIFVKLGAVVVAVTVLSIVGAIVTLPAALMLVGPAPDAWYKRQLRRLKQLLTGGRTGAEQDRPLLQDWPTGQELGSDEEGQIYMLS